MQRTNKILATNSRGDSYYVSPSAIDASELSVTTPKIFVTADPDDVATYRKKDWDKQFENTTTDKPKWYEGYGDPHRNSAYHPADALEFLNVMTAGGMNNLSPTQWTRRVYDAGKLAKGDMSWSNYINSWINGNNGVVTDEFAKEHPYWSTGFNLFGDVIGIAGIANVGKIANAGKTVPIVSRNYRGLLNNKTQPVQFVNLEETFTPVTRQFVHPSEAIRKAYTAPNLERLEMTTAEPLMNRSAVGKVPEGAKIVGEFKGEPLIEINGKKYLLSKYNELHGGAPDLGYDPKVIAEEAKKDFTGPLARIIDNSEVLTSLADKIKRGEATTEFSRNKGTLVDPNARDVLAGELADIKRGKQKRGVALVNTMPTNITTTGQETYAGRGNFGLGSFSVTNHPGAVRAYGAIDYPKLIQHIKDSKMLTDNEKNSLYSYLKRMKELDKDPLSRMTENTDAKIKLNPEEDIEYQNLISQVNKLIPGTFEYGGLNRHILYQALKEPQIINVSSKSDKFGVSSRNVAREQLPLTDFQGHRLMTFNPKYNPNKSTSVEQVHGGYVGNILEAERLIGGYKYKNKFGNWEKEPGWNQTPSILQNLMGLLRGTNGKFYVRGVGPNGVPGAIDMVTLQAPNGGIPGFKLGNKLNYYKHV